MPIGERLREERNRLGMSQPAFAAIAGTTKQTLFSWETGKTGPDAFQIALLAEAGVDVLYVLTGQRTPSVAQSLKPDEAALLDNYRHLRPDQQTLLKATSDAFAQHALTGHGHKVANG